MTDHWTAEDVRHMIRDERNRAIVGDELWTRAQELLDREEAGEDVLDEFATAATERVSELIGARSPSTYWEALERKWALVKQPETAPTRDRLAAAAVYFLHQEIIDLVVASSKSLDRWEVAPSDFITPHGFVWLERPLQDPLGIQGFLWLSNEEEEKVMVAAVDALGIRATLAAAIGADILDPDVLARERAQFQTGGFESVHELRFIASAILFTSQEILVRQAEHPPRHVARRLSREQRPSVAKESISVLVLRRQHAPSASAGSDDAPHSVDWACRWAVRGHWRQQPVGPERAQRRPTWIHPYVKGPDDRPFKPPSGQIFDVRR